MYLCTFKMKQEEPQFVVKVNRQEFRFTENELDDCLIRHIDDANYELRWNNRNIHIEILHKDIETGEMIFRIERKKLSISLQSPLGQLIESLGFNNAKSLYTDALIAPMPGLVLDILVEEGQTVQKGDHLITLEAMKMENILRAQHDGTIGKILVSTSDKVEKNQLLINFSARTNESV